MGHRPLSGWMSDADASQVKSERTVKFSFPNGIVNGLFHCWKFASTCSLGPNLPSAPLASASAWVTSASFPRRSGFWRSARATQSSMLIERVVCAATDDDAPQSAKVTVTAGSPTRRILEKLILFLRLLTRVNGYVRAHTGAQRMIGR